MITTLEEVIVGFNWFVLAYFLLLNSTQLVLIGLAALDIAGSFRWSGSKGFDELFANPLTPGISVIVPAYNESAGIAQSVRAMLMTRYPLHEVIVVDDGSTDGTFEILQDVFDLVRIRRTAPGQIPLIGEVQSIWAASTGEPLTIVRKENAGRRSDALNAGLNYARHELVCMVDADSILEEDALLRVVKPFVDDPDRVVGTGGVIRAVNGALVDRGRVVDVRAPSSWAQRIQIVEYLRSFLLGRTGWSRISGLLIISGAFGLFRKDLVYELGGLESNSLAEDADLVAAIHRHMRRERRDYRLVFVPDPVCWTEVPPTYRTLARQRRRWSHGLAQLMWKYRTMIGNPRYRVIGLVTMPFYLLFEALSPVVELAGIAAVITALALGLLNWPFVALFAFAALGFGVLLSIAAITVEELTFHRYHRWRDLVALLTATLFETIGYRQLHAFWRLRGLINAMGRKAPQWGAMPRAGFQPPPEEPADASIRELTHSGM
jgi:cellulose synthase/poly-beta-1,6-N-acetylglucosamine synthase-like glycosyltransferase